MRICNLFQIVGGTFEATVESLWFCVVLFHVGPLRLSQEQLLKLDGVISSHFTFFNPFVIFLLLLGLASLRGHGVSSYFFNHNAFTSYSMVTKVSLNLGSRTVVVLRAVPNDLLA